MSIRVQHRPARPAPPPARAERAAPPRHAGARRDEVEEPRGFFGRVAHAFRVATKRDVLREPDAAQTARDGVAHLTATPAQTRVADLEHELRALVDRATAPTADEVSALFAALPRTRDDGVVGSELDALFALRARFDEPCGALDGRLDTLLTRLSWGVGLSAGRGTTERGVRAAIQHLRARDGKLSSSSPELTQLIAWAPDDDTRVRLVRCALEHGYDRAARFALKKVSADALRPHLGALFQDDATRTALSSGITGSFHVSGAHPMERILIECALDDEASPPLRAHVATAVHRGGPATDLFAAALAFARLEGGGALLREKTADLHPVAAQVVAFASAPDAGEDVQAKAAVCFHALATPGAFRASMEAAAQTGLLDELGIPRLAIDYARACAAAATDDRLSALAAHRDGSSALARTSVDEQARLVRLVAHEDAATPRRRALAALPARTTTPKAPLDRLGAPLAALSGFQTVLPAAAAALPRGPRQRGFVLATPDEALSRKQPALWLPLLLDRSTSGVRGFPRRAIDDVTKRAADAVDAWRTTSLAKAKAGSATMLAREGTVSATAFALALLTLERAQHGPSADLPLDAILASAGQAACAKDGPSRTAFLHALFQVSVLASRIGATAPTWAVVDEALAACTGKDLKAATRALDAAAQTIRDAHPADSDLAEKLATLVDGRRGGKGLVRFAEGITAIFERGVERASIARIAASIEHGTLDVDRRKTLRRERFPHSTLDDAALERVFDAFSAGGALPGADLLAEAKLARTDKRATHELIDSADPLDWTRAVDDVTSCQKTTGDPQLNCGLLNRFEDGTVRLIALRDANGDTKLRAALRLVVLEGGEVALLVDQIYAASHGADQEDLALLDAFVRRRAQAVGVPLARPAREGAAPTERHTVRVASLIATDYHDLGNGVVHPRDGSARLSVRLSVDRSTRRGTPLLAR